MEDVVDKRKAQVLHYLKNKPTVLVYVVLALLAWLGYHIRTRNIPLLTDVSTGNYIPLALDPFVFLRYVRYIIENGSLMTVDTLRYYPLGFTGLSEFQFLSYTIAYFYKFLSFFNPSVTVEYAHIIYPPVAFVVGLFFFFLFLKKVFNWKVALIASAFLTVIPSYLYRTMAGFADKEALAMVFLFLGMWAFVSMFKEKNFKKGLLYSVLAGIGIGLMWITWGGVSFVLVTIGVFMVLYVLFMRFQKKHWYFYTLFLAVAVLILRMGFPERASLASLTTSVTTGFLFLALVLGLVHYLLFHKKVYKNIDKFKHLPHAFVSYLVVIVLALIGVVILYGPSFIIERLGDLYTILVSPFITDRWALTVAESQQPYFSDWISQFGWPFLLTVFGGAVILFYETVKVLGKKRSRLLTGAFALFLIAFSMSRYSSGASVFNGETTLSILTYVGSVILFGVFFLYQVYDLYKNDKEHYQKLLHINAGYLFSLLFLVFVIVGARSAIRLLFLFAPVTAIFAGYFFYQVGMYAWAYKDNLFKYGVIFVLVISALFLFNAYTQSSLAQAAGTGPSYHQQWQVGMSWVQENTPEDAVFAHWWDYGYWVQTGANRATLSDGGNARGGINHFIGRHLLTGADEREALELLAANDATHVLMVADEIGKYTAYSSIGSDADYDRYSWINIFTLDHGQVYESRDATNLVYVGGTVLDDDIIYNGQLFPAYNSGVAGIIVPVVLDENSAISDVQQPRIILSYNNEFVEAPLECVYIDGQEYTFDVSEGVEGCIMVVPRVNSGQVDTIGAAFYLSRDVYNTVFTHLYLFGEEWEYIKLVYSDEENVPLMYYEGQVIGPMKIWEVIGYPDDLVIPEEYYGTEIPDEVTEVKQLG